MNQQNLLGQAICRRWTRKWLFRAMRARGATLVTPQSMISAAKINGIDLLAHLQDYVLNGVKVQFFTDPDGQRYVDGMQGVKGWCFGLMDMPHLFM